MEYRIIIKESAVYRTSIAIQIKLFFVWLTIHVYSVKGLTKNERKKYAEDIIVFEKKKRKITKIIRK